MTVSWAEALWVNSPARSFLQRRDLHFLCRLRAPSPGARILEIGCGRGYAVELIHRAFRPARVEGVDLDPAMVRRANRRRRVRRLTHAVFHHADAHRLPHPDDCMDIVFEFGIIHHLEDWRRGLHEIRRVLRPGGAFYFEEIYPDLYANAVTRPLLRHPRADRFRGPELRAELHRQGLDLVPGYRESRYRILAVALKQ